MKDNCIIQQHLPKRIFLFLRANKPLEIKILSLTRKLKLLNMSELLPLIILLHLAQQVALGSLRWANHSLLWCEEQELVRWGMRQDVLTMISLNSITGTGCKDYPYTFPYFRLLLKPNSKPLTVPEKAEPEQPNNGPQKS